MNGRQKMSGFGRISFLFILALIVILIGILFIFTPINEKITKVFESIDFGRQTAAVVLVEGSTTRIWIEGSEGSRSGTMTLESSSQSITGQFVYPNSTNDNLSCSTNNNKITYTISVPTSGNYYAWGRFYYPSTVSNAANSFCLQIDNGSVSRFGNNQDFLGQVHWDGDGVVESGSPTKLNLGSLSAGSHTVTIYQREASVGMPPRLDAILLTNESSYVPSDNDALSAFSGTTPPPTSDTTAPSIPSSLSATTISSSQINLSWNASTDNVGVTGYRVYRNNSLINTVTTTSFSDSGLSPSTTYTYRVSAIDAAGNASSQSSPVSATTDSGVVVPPPTGDNGFYYVAPSGNNSGGTSWTNAWRNFSDINWNNIQAGDTIYVAGGTYTASLSPQKSGTSGNPITIKKATSAEHGTNTGWQSSFSNQAILVGNSNIDIRDKDYIVVDGVRGETSSNALGEAVSFGIKIDSNAGTGIYIQGSDYITIQYIHVDGTNNSNSNGMVGFNSVNEGSSPSSNNITIRNNWFNDMENDALKIGNFNNSIIESNSIGPRKSSSSGKCGSSNGCHGDGVEIRGTNNIVFRNNKINFAADTLLFGINKGSSGRWDIYNNIWLYSSGYAIRGHSDYDRGFSMTAGPLYIYNNVFLNIGYGAILMKPGMSGVIKNNIFYLTGNGGTGSFGSLSSSHNYYNSGSHNNAGNIVSSSDPFVSISSNNFRLKSNSAAINTGANLGSTYSTDADGNSRGAGGAWDIGPYEYTGTTPPPTSDTTSPSVPSSLSATTISSSQINLNWNASTDNVGVTGYRVYRNNSLINTVTTTSFSDSGLSPSTTYTYRVSAIDAAGNASAQSSPASATTDSGVVVPPNTSGVYYIDSVLGNDNNPGTASLPWRTIGRALDTTKLPIAGPGNTVIVRPGAYAEGTITFPSGRVWGTASNKLIFKAEPRRLALIRGFDTSNADYVQIEGFNISSSVGGGGTAGVSVDSDGVRVIDNYIFNITTDAAISGSNSSDNIQILNNHTFNTQYGIVLRGTNWLVAGNEIQGLKRASGSGDDADYMRFWGSGHTIRGNYLHGTNFSDIGDAHVDGFQSWSFNSSTIAQNIIIEGNIIQNSHQGLILESSQLGKIGNITVRNNIFDGMATWGVLAKYGIENINVSHNIFMNMGLFSVVFRGDGSNPGTTGSIRNNIFYNNTKQDPWCGKSRPTDTYFLCDEASAQMGNNLIFNSGTTPIVSDIKNQNPNFTNISNLIGNDGIPFTIDDGYRLLASSPAINAGANVGVITDIFDNSRPLGSGYDIGPYEYTGTTPPPTSDTTSPSTPSSLSVTTISSSQINLNWNASTDNVGVTGYRVYRNNSLINTVTTTSFSDSGLSPSTTYTYRVSAIDAAGNASAQSSLASATTDSGVVADTTSPSTPSSLSVTTISSSQINLNWNASTDNVGVTGYRVYRNGVFFGETTATSVTNIGLSPNTVYTYQVGAIDAALNESTKSATVSARTKKSAKSPTHNVWGRGKDTKTSNGKMKVDSTYSTSSSNNSSQLANSTLAFSQLSQAQGSDTTVTTGSLAGEMLYSDRSGDNIDCDPVGDYVSYNINVPTTDIWYAWGRFYYPSSMSNPANSFCIRVDNGPIYVFGNNQDFKQVFHWDGDGQIESGSPQGLSLGLLAAGDHIVIIYPREVTVGPPPRLDVFMITNDSDYTPSDSDAVSVLGKASTNTTGSTQTSSGGGSTQTTSTTITSTGDTQVTVNTTLPDGNTRTDTARSSGGGGGGGSSNKTPTVLNPGARINLLNFTNPLISPIASSRSFSRNLTVGSRGNDVLALQRLLNASGFQISTTGGGSPGNETDYFGSLTRSALARFQAANSISPPSGFFGPLTRSFVAKVSGTVSTPSAPNTTVTQPPVSTNGFSRNLTVGSRGNDVLALQRLLNASGFQISTTGGGSPGNETDYFGTLTRSALARFQAANSISPPSGFFGPLTRSFVQKLLGQ